MGSLELLKVKARFYFRAQNVNKGILPQTTMTINKPDAPISLHTESHNTNFDAFILGLIAKIKPGLT